MANWTTRKSRSQKISKNTNWRTTDTFTYGKGLTNSQSFGGKNGRTTFSTSHNGTKMYDTIRSGDMWKRTQRTISSNKTRKISKREAKALGNAIAFLIMLPFKILGWIFK